MNPPRKRKPREKVKRKPRNQVNRRLKNQGQWLDNLNELITSAAEALITKATFTERIHAIMVLEPYNGKAMSMVEQLLQPNEREEDVTDREIDDELTPKHNKPTYNSIEKRIKECQKHFHNNDLSKGRKVFSSAGIRSLSDPKVIEEIRSKFPSDEIRSCISKIGTAEEESDVIEDDELIGNAEQLMRYIFKKRDGASAGVNGHSNDHY